jgi:hypothetical protein
MTKYTPNYMTKNTPKKDLLVLGCAAIALGLMFVSFAVALLVLYGKYDGHMLQVPASDVGKVIRLTAALSFTIAIFVGYTAWVALKSRNHLRDE